MKEYNKCSNVFELEKHMISPSEWSEKIPSHVIEQLGVKTAEEVIEESKRGGPIGFGYTEETGWYILMSGQGPFVFWIEKAKTICNEPLGRCQWRS